MCAHLLVAVLLASVPLAEQLAPTPAHARKQAPSTASDIVARVNGAPIQAAELEAALNAVIPVNSYHQNVKPEKLAEMRTQAIEGLIDEELRYQEAVRLKMRVTPAEVEQALARARGTYPNPDAFERARRASGATMPQLRASLSRALMIQKVYERVVASTCTVTEADAALYYRQNTARFMMPEQMRVSLVTIGVDPSASPAEWKRARQKADGVARQIAAGASFDALAREHAATATTLKGGDLGFVHRGQLIEEFERALKSLRPGQVSGVIQTIYGFHLLRLVELRPAAQKSFADVKTTLARDLTETRCKEASLAWTKRLRAEARVDIVGSSTARRTTG